MTLTVGTLDELRPLVGTELGSSNWIEVDQARINTFADATGDHQWIHVDEVQARQGPFGGTIAHGFLVLSLIIPMWTEILEVRDVTTKVNYGLGRVRFPAPVPAGSKLQGTATLTSLEEIAGGARLTVDMVIHREGGGKPVCVAQPIFHFRV